MKAEGVISMFSNGALAANSMPKSCFACRLSASHYLKPIHASRQRCSYFVAGVVSDLRVSAFLARRFMMLLYKSIPARLTAPVTTNTTIASV